MAAVSPARANTLLLGVMTFAQLLLMAANVRGGMAASTVAAVVGAASRPAVSAERSVSGVLLDVVHFFRDLHADGVANVKLHLEVTRLSGELERTRELAEENAHLRKLLDMHEELVPKSIGASVVTARLGVQSRVLLVGYSRGADVLPFMASRLPRDATEYAEKGVNAG